jgi:hypothetical protein
MNAELALPIRSPELTQGNIAISEVKINSFNQGLRVGERNHEKMSVL